MSEKTIVIKYGGHAMDNDALRADFLANLKELVDDGTAVVVVHGGGPQINGLLKRLNIPGQFVDGLRVTDAETLAAVEMALCGQVNKAVTRLLRDAGLNAVGVSGEDGGLLTARQIKPELGYVGEITGVDPALIENLLAGGFVPVVAPLALDLDGKPLNINADTAAAALAGALRASHFILVSDVPGVLDAEGKLYSYLSGKAAEELIDGGVIRDGMIPKTRACLAAVSRGCESSFILDGRAPNALRDYLRRSSARGTRLGG